MRPILLAPAYKDYIWGGVKLKYDYGKKNGPSVIAESWELSCNENGLSFIGDNGGTFKDWLARHSDALGIQSGGEFPILVKLIDAKEDLSVQVHPNDSYALEHENGPGKTEMWYVMEHEPGAALFMGFSKNVTRTELKKAIADNRLEKMLNRITVRKGDVFFIPAGIVHAVGKGIILAEIQQNSDLTYRMYDYGRRDALGNARKLHIEKALDVAVTNKTESIEMCRQIIVSDDSHRESLLCRCDYFSVYHVDLDGSYNFSTSPACFETLLFLRGRCALTSNANEFYLIKGESVFLPANMGCYSLEGNCEYLRIYGLDTAYIV